jgi:EAL domain-containing protein (putative c-di-GMP-specific phosphodiesterase class I)
VQTQEYRTLGIDSSSAAQICRALAGDGLAVEYQPIFDLRDGSVIGLEALARFSIEPRRGPAAWFEEARRFGLGVDLETAAIRTALERVADLPPGVFLSVNVSLEAAQSAPFAQQLWASRPDRIVIEVRAGEAATEDMVAEGLDRVRTMGVRLALDDVRDDAATLARLMALEPEFVKLDIGLCRNIHLDPSRQRAVQRLLLLAAGSNATVLAEGIQSRGEVDALRDLSVVHGQGYFMAVPSPSPLAGFAASGRLGPAG